MFGSHNFTAVQSAGGVLVNCKPWEERRLPRLDRFKRPGARPRCQTRELCISACAPVGIGRHVVACTVLVNQGC
jgi:hypothetical protein